jgi:hypothetical protein
MAARSAVLDRGRLACLAAPKARQLVAGVVSHRSTPAANNRVGSIER